MASCGQMIEGRVVSFSCDLDAGHDGPHRAYENSRSVRERAKWEREKKAAEVQQVLSQFQGPAQTTAERYTENPTPVPGPKPVSDASADYETSETIPEEQVIFEEHDDGSSTFGPAPTKQREGDQPLPQSTQGEYVQDRIIAKINALRANGSMPDELAADLIAKMEASKKVGMQRYGTALQTFNGRDVLQDAAEEARDLYVYLNSLIQAREAEYADLVEVVQREIEREYSDGAPDRGLYEVLPNAEALAKIAVGTILKATGGFGT